MIKITYFFLVSLLLTSIPSVGQPKAKAPIDWKAVHEAFAAYSEYPSHANATHVADLLPESGHVEYTSDKREHETVEFVNQNLDMLERQVISRDPASIKLAFRLMTIADGEFAESLEIALGQLIRIDPTLFLRQLKEAKDQIIGLGGLTGNYGYVFVDKVEAQRLETARRIDSLEGVTDPALREIRNECILALKK
jgi:hypothetical protein